MMDFTYLLINYNMKYDGFYAKTKTHDTIDHETESSALSNKKGFTS